LSFTNSTPTQYPWESPGKDQKGMTPHAIVGRHSSVPINLLPRSMCILLLNLSAPYLKTGGHPNLVYSIVNWVFRQSICQICGSVSTATFTPINLDAILRRKSFYYFSPVRHGIGYANSKKVEQSRIFKNKPQYTKKEATKSIREYTFWAYVVVFTTVS
jgi:hypothetical protein